MPHCLGKVSCLHSMILGTRSQHSEERQLAAAVSEEYVAM